MDYSMKIDKLETEQSDLNGAWDYLDSAANNIKDYYKDEYNQIVDIMQTLEGRLDDIKEELDELYYIESEENKKEKNAMNIQFERSRI